MSDYNNNHHNEIMSYMHELAGLLHYADENHKLCVSGETMRNAIDIARYYEVLKTMTAQQSPL